MNFNLKIPLNKINKSEEEEKNVETSTTSNGNFFFLFLEKLTFIYRK